MTTPRSTRHIFRFLLLTLITLVFGSGCAAHIHPHAHSPRHHHDRAKVVVIKKGHTHNKSCGHYRHGHRWYHVERHVHGKRCGHVLVRGVWVLKR